MKSKIFKDREALTSGHTPKLSPYRDYQLRRLIDAFTPILKESEPPVQMVAHGGIGAGKTMVARQLRHSLEFKACKEEASLRCIHIDCMKERTLGGIVRLLASLFSPTMPLRGYSLEETFLTALREARAKRLRVLLIIDGADPIFKSHPKMAVLLSRMYEVSPKHTNPSLLITLRSLDVFSQMEPWAVRSLRKNVIEFDNYDRDQLEAILEYRVRYAFQRRALPKETLASCIDLASDHGGNMKYVLELLKKAGERAESSGRSVVTSNHISKAVEQISPSFTFEELEDLSTHEKLIMLSSVHLLDSTQRACISMGELEEAYIKLSKMYGLRPVGHTWLWKTVGTLSMLGFLEKRLSGLGRKGKTTLIEVPIKSKKHLYKELSSLIRRRTAKSPELELSQDTL